jgi:hypothetical protein
LLAFAAGQPSLNVSSRTDDLAALCACSRTLLPFRLGKSARVKRFVRLKPEGRRWKAVQQLLDLTAFSLHAAGRFVPTAMALFRPRQVVLRVRGKTRLQRVP